MLVKFNIYLPGLPVRARSTCHDRWATKKSLANMHVKFHMNAKQMLLKTVAILAASIAVTPPIVYTSRPLC